MNEIPGSLGLEGGGVEVIDLFVMKNIIELNYKQYGKR
jgi:hypothetical protein